MFDIISDEPTHIDFMRIVSGAKIILEIPVRFINNELSPGLKRGGVLNIVRRKVELKCPTENIPTELVVDLEGLDIGTSLSVLRNWKVSENEIWVRVELAYNKLLDDPNKIKKGWIKI